MHSSAYLQQLDGKISFLRNLFTGISIPEWEVFPSPDRHYRMRAEFRIWHEGEEISYAMFEHGRKAGSASLIRLTELPAASEAINRLMPVLLDTLRTEPLLKNRLYQCEFLSTLSGDMLLTLIYHRKLDEQWRMAAEKLQQQYGIAVIGRSKGQKIVLQKDFVTETLHVGQEKFHYRQIEGGFSQPNAVVCEKMLAWASRQVQDLDGDLLELYCGNGNFTIPLSRHFRRVLATEVSKTSVQAAQWNIEANDADNIRIARLSAEEFTAAFSGNREFRRLHEQKINLADYRFSTVFVDPPRAGVDSETLKLLQRFDNILYISCNPETLRANLDILTQTHNVTAAALFDQFPFSHHIESGVLLQSKAV